MLAMMNMGRIIPDGMETLSQDVGAGKKRAG
jgi:hypothetical protein